MKASLSEIKKKLVNFPRFCIMVVHPARFAGRAQDGRDLRGPFIGVNGNESVNLGTL